jgi:stage II sporulation protein GA (sporulation sigma-E factor processing peptidase)
LRYEWYIDLYLLINLLMDAGLLWSLGKSFQIPLRWRQIVAGAAFGAVGACGEVWIRLLFLDIGTKMRVPVAKAVVGIQVISIILLLLFPAGMIRLCFGRRDWRTFLKLYVMLYLEAFLAGGILEAVRQQVEVRGVPFWAVFFLTAGVFFLIRFFYLFYQDVKEERKYCYPVVLKYGKQKVNAIGYLDTGNQLVRPKDRVPVHVVSEQVWKQLFDGADKEEKIPGEIIPFSTIGNPYGKYF